MTPQRWFWIVAGSNGAGKSTYAKTILTVPIIDPDNPLPGTTFDPFAAGRKTLEWVDAQVDARRSFGIESTLSGLGYIRLAKRLKAGNWRCGLIYVGLSSPELAVVRVKQRYESGGHTVPEDDIRRRYARSLENLPQALDLADVALVFDNSRAEASFRLVLEKRDNALMPQTRPLPPWLATALGEQP